MAGRPIGRPAFAYAACKKHDLSAFYSNRIRIFGNLRKFVLKKILFYAIIYISVRTMGTGDVKKLRKNNPAARQRAGHIIERYIGLSAKKFF